MIEIYPNSGEVMLMAIDLLDRIGCNLSEPIDINSLAISVIAIATAVYGEDYEPESLAELLEVPYPEKYGETISNIIRNLEGHLYRPTLDLIMGISTEEALKILMKTLSPSKIIGS